MLKSKDFKVDMCKLITSSDGLSQLHSYGFVALAWMGVTSEQGGGGGGGRGNEIQLKNQLWILDNKITCTSIYCIVDIGENIVVSISYLKFKARPVFINVICAEVDVMNVGQISTFRFNYSLLGHPPLDSFFWFSTLVICHSPSSSLQIEMDPFKWLNPK